MKSEQKNTFDNIVSFSRGALSDDFDQSHFKVHDKHGQILSLNVNRWATRTHNRNPTSHSIERILGTPKNQQNDGNSDDINDSIEDLIVRASATAFPESGSSEKDLIQMQKRLRRAKTATAELHQTLSTAEKTLASQLGSMRPNQNWFDRTYSHLARLDDGWSGDTSEAPSPRQLSDFSKLRSILDTLGTKPTVQVEDDGLIGLFWEHSAKTFCLSILGGGKVMGTLSPYRLNYESWIIDVNDEQRLLNLLNDDQLSELFTTDAV